MKYQITFLLLFIFNIAFGQSRGENDPVKFRIEAEVGVSYRTGKISGALPDTYKNQLRPAFPIGGSLHYFQNSRPGIGFRFSQVSIKHAEDLAGLGNVSDNMRISFYGLSLLSPYELNRIHFGVSAGILQFKNDALDNGIRLKFEGQSFGMELRTGYDFRVIQKMIVGIALSSIVGTIKNSTVNGVSSSTISSDSDEGLSRINLSIGLRFLR